MTSGPHVATPSSHCHHGDHSCMDFNQFPLGVTDLVLPLHVLRNSRFLLWAFSDRAWDSYISSPGGTVQKLRGWLSRSHPRLMSCPKGKFWDAFGTLLWTLPGMNLRCPWEKPTRPSLWAGFPTVSVPPPPPPSCKCCSLRPLPIQTSCKEAVFRIRSGGIPATRSAYSTSDAYIPSHSKFWWFCNCSLAEFSSAQWSL